MAPVYCRRAPPENPNLWLIAPASDPLYNVSTVDFFTLSAPRKEDAHLNRKYISSVKPLTDYVLQVDFVSGSRLLLDMKPYLDKIRFRTLTDPQVWDSAVTNGIFVRFGNVELSHDELLSMAEREH